MSVTRIRFLPMRMSLRSGQSIRRLAFFGWTGEWRDAGVVYNFACHPILEVPSRENTADISGFGVKSDEDNLSEDTIALFLQGCGGDVNPVLYKDVNNPRDAEVLGNMLGLSTLQALKKYP